MMYLTGLIAVFCLGCYAGYRGYYTYCDYMFRTYPAQFLAKVEYRLEAAGMLKHEDRKYPWPPKEGMFDEKKKG